ERGDEEEGGVDPGAEEEGGDEDRAESPVTQDAHDVAPEPAADSRLTVRRPDLARARRERERQEREAAGHEEEEGPAAAGDQRLGERGAETVRRHPRDAEDRDTFDAAAGGHEIGGIGEVAREEGPADDEVERGEHEEQRADAADQEEGHERERVRGAAPEEHPATTDAV